MEDVKQWRDFNINDIDENTSKHFQVISNTIDNNEFIFVMEVTNNVKPSMSRKTLKIFLELEEYKDVTTKWFNKPVPGLYKSKDRSIEVVELIENIFEEFHKHSALSDAQRCPHSCPLKTLCDVLEERSHASMKSFEAHPCELKNYINIK